MSITAGTRIGPYEVTSQLGQGGMGVVFRARDTRLQRDVALKLLPSHLAGDPDRLARLQREAQVLASLNHPNIAQIYGLEQAGSSCIVMELVEGETLAERIKRGPIPLTDALPMALQIVDALEAAHERGIVHRDLKPANIKLTPDGKVKVLDFGLAKALSKSSETDPSNSPTVMDGSVVGVVMGTAAYMSPEQARGKQIDARTDIWAFGCVLYEMLTGRQVFESETATDIIAKIVAGHPDWDRLSGNTPASIRILLRLSLDKEPKQRLQHVGDVRPFLNSDVFTESSQSNARPNAHRRRGWLAAGVLGILLIAALAALYFRSPSEDSSQISFEMPRQRGSGLSISPDGQRLAYITLSEGRPAIWIQPIGSLTARPLPGTEGAAAPFWSPDSRFVAFFSDRKLKKIDVSGGTVQTLCEANGPALQGAWSRDDVILFTSQFPGATGGVQGLVRVSASGGTVTPATATLSGNELFHLLPSFLSDGRHFVFNAADALGPNPKFALYLGFLDSSSTTRVMDLGESSAGNFPAVYRSGYLLFRRSGTLMAQRFDENRYTSVGPALVVAENVGVADAASQTGVLVYQKPVPQQLDLVRQQLLWLDRNGKPVGEAAAPAAYQTPSISRDGRRLAIATRDSSTANWDVWVIDLTSNVSSQLTFDPGIDTLPIWHPDGSRIAFAADRGDRQFNAPRMIYERMANGAGTDQLLFESGLEMAIPSDWSPDGQNVVFYRESPNASGADLWILPVSGDRKPIPYLQSSHRKRHAQFSPDGRWIAYTSDESGASNVFVQPFPDPTQGKWRVSLRGGAEPRWRRDGRELFYLALDGTLMAVPVKSGAAFEHEPAIPLFPTPLKVASQGPNFRYDAAPEGQRFLIIAPAAPATPRNEAASALTPITVVINWTAALRK